MNKKDSFIKLKISKTGQLYLTTPQGEEIKNCTDITIDQDPTYASAGIARVNVNILVNTKPNDLVLKIKGPDLVSINVKKNKDE